jgi:hypothetical protein
MTLDTHAPTPRQSASRAAQELAAYVRISAPGAPTEPVRARAGSIVDPAALRLASDAAVKHNTSAGRPGYPSATSHWQTHLHVEAWVRNASFAKRVWADVHAFGHDGALVESGTFALAYARPAGDGGDLFQLDLAVHEGPTTTPGSAEPRCDVRSVQYRLYYQFDARVLTDGILHDCQLRSDTVSH